ncbi:MAG: hypothetical protein K9L86_00550 [Candidatus Omnitrophica bacterium]|nr:hypothetical protein [Candidatus Omnitrophota bacterium]
MCFYWKRIENAKAEEELNLNEIEAISRSFDWIMNLAISGGEPFLRDDLDQICFIFYKNNHLRFMNIPTNGSFPAKISLMTEKILRLCKKSTVTIELSIDGIGEAHDHIRGVGGSFDKLEDTYWRLSKLKKRYGNLRLAAATTFSYYNQNQLKEIISYIKQKNFLDDFTISTVHGNPRDPMAKSFGLDKYTEAMNLLYKDKLCSKKAFERGLRALRKSVTQEVVNVIKYGRLRSPCTAGNKIIVIDETGNVFPCEPISERIGSLRDDGYDIKKIIYSKKRYDFEKKYKINSECSCNWECAILNNVIYNPKNLPYLIRNWFIGC